MCKEHKVQAERVFDFCSGFEDSWRKLWRNVFWWLGSVHLKQCIGYCSIPCDSSVEIVLLVELEVDQGVRWPVCVGSMKYEPRGCLIWALAARISGESCGRGCFCGWRVFT